MVNRDALKQYRNVGTKSAVEEATPHRLVQMLIEGALAQIAAAGGHIDRNEVAMKGAAIGQAISIIGGLQGCLDFEHGGEIASNLDRLYDYMVRTLTDANLKNDAAKVREVHDLLGEIKHAWERVGEEIAPNQDPAATDSPGARAGS